MPHTFTCKHCSHQSSVSDRLFAERIAGKVLSMPCKRCGAPLTLDGTVHAKDSSAQPVRPPPESPSRGLRAAPGAPPGAMAPPPRAMPKSTSSPTLAASAKAQSSAMAPKPASGERSVSPVPFASRAKTGVASRVEAAVPRPSLAKPPETVASSAKKPPAERAHAKPGSAPRPAIDRRLLVPRPASDDAVGPLLTAATTPNPPSNVSAPAAAVETAIDATLSNPAEVERITQPSLCNQEITDDYQDVTSSMVVSSVPRLPVVPALPIVVASSDESVAPEVSSSSVPPAPESAATIPRSPRLGSESHSASAMERPSDNELTPPAMTRTLDAVSELPAATAPQSSQPIARKSSLARIAWFSGAGVALSIALGFGVTQFRQDPKTSQQFAREVITDRSKLSSAVAADAPVADRGSNNGVAQAPTVELAHNAPASNSSESVRNAAPAADPSSESVRKASATKPSAESAESAALSPPTSNELPDYVAKANVQAMTDLALRRAQRCHPNGHAVGTVQVFVTFAPNGSVTNARLEGEPVASAPVGRCILDYARSIRIAKFNGASFTYSKSLTMR